MDHEEDIDGDVDVEEPCLGYYASHSFSLSQESHYWALTRGPTYLQGVRHFTEARWARLHHNRLPAIFGQSEATSVFAL